MTTAAAMKAVTRLSTPAKLVDRPVMSTRVTPSTVTGAPETAIASCARQMYQGDPGVLLEGVQALSSAADVIDGEDTTN